MPRTVKPSQVGPGSVKVTVRITFPDGSDAYRSGVITSDKADRLAFKFARALNAAWLFSLTDNEPDPDVATLGDQVLKELNPMSSDFNRFGHGRKDI